MPLPIGLIAPVIAERQRNEVFSRYLDDLYGKSEEFQQASETIQLSLLEMIAGRIEGLVFNANSANGLNEVDFDCFVDDVNQSLDLIVTFRTDARTCPVRLMRSQLIDRLRAAGLLRPDCWKA